MYEKRFALAFNDQMSGKLANLIIDHELKGRDANKGMACFDLVIGAVDLESYPPELRERLDELLGDDVKPE